MNLLFNALFIMRSLKYISINVRLILPPKLALIVRIVVLKEIFTK